MPPLTPTLSTIFFDTTLDTVETTGDNTSSSSSVNPISMDGTLHLRYIPTDTEDYAGDDEDNDEDNISKPKNTPCSLVDLPYDETMTEEESSEIHIFGAETTENATTSSGEILDVWSVHEVHETDDDGPPILEINHAPIGVGGNFESTRSQRNRKPVDQTPANPEPGHNFLGVHLLAALSLLILLPGVLCLLPTTNTPTSSLS